MQHARWLVQSLQSPDFFFGAVVSLAVSGTQSRASHCTADKGYALGRQIPALRFRISDHHCAEQYTMAGKLAIHAQKKRFNPKKRNTRK